MARPLRFGDILAMAHLVSLSYTATTDEDLRLMKYLFTIGRLRTMYWGA